MRRLFALLLVLGLIAETVPAQLEIYGFVEAAMGVRTASVGASPAEWQSQGDLPSAWAERPNLLMQEARVQLKGDAYGDLGEAHVKLDFVAGSPYESDEDVELREGFVKFSSFGDELDVRAGRQPTTWGTGDLLFINDLFPKDWQSFFLGRADEYLKRPSDALRLSLFALPIDLDLVYTPRFAPDRIPAGERLTFWSPALLPSQLPDRDVENGEFALRASRFVGGFTVAAYGYAGFWKTPVGMNENMSAFYHPELRVYGGSMRGALFGGVAWVEGGYYDSVEDRGAESPFVPNSEVRGLVGYERQWWSDFTGGMQAYAESQESSGDEAASGGADEKDRVLLTFRARQQLMSQTLTAGAFLYHSPTHDDGYLRLSLEYAYTDALTLTLGSNLFYGEDQTTTFGMSDENDNVFGRVRFGF